MSQKFEVVVVIDRWVCEFLKSLQKYKKLNHDYELEGKKDESTKVIKKCISCVNWQIYLLHITFPL